MLIWKELFAQVLKHFWGQHDVSKVLAASLRDLGEENGG